MQSPMSYYWLQEHLRQQAFAPLIAAEAHLSVATACVIIFFDTTVD
jgi:hypothetical protein